jgi:hypothetical protein
MVARGRAVTAPDRPQDPIPPEYQDPPATPAHEAPAFQTYQPYPQGHMPYPAHQYYPPQGMPPPNHLGWAIAGLLLFFPTGIAAIIKSTQVDRYWLMGQHQMAEEASRSARILGLISVVIAVALFILWITMFLVMFRTFTDQIPAPPR